MHALYFVRYIYFFFVVSFLLKKKQTKKTEKKSRSAVSRSVVPCSVVPRITNNHAKTLVDEGRPIALKTRFLDFPHRGERKKLPWDRIPRGRFHTTI